MADTTVLTLTGMALPPYSARGLKQTLEPIGGAAQLMRSVNGDLTDVSDPLFRKYQSTITGGDQDPPALSGIWPGMEVTVGCIVELASNGSGDRPAVSGSSRTADGITFYRPELTMLVTGFNVSHDEYDRQIGWTLTLEEV